jgi:hypothetical protein
MPEASEDYFFKERTSTGFSGESATTAEFNGWAEGSRNLGAGELKTLSDVQIKYTPGTTCLRAGLSVQLKQEAQTS